VNEFDLVREAFPPDEDRTAREVAGPARRELQSMAATGGKRVRTARPVRWGLAVTAVGAAATLVVLGLPMLTADHRHEQQPDVAGAGPVIQLTASQALVAAAVQQEQHTTPSGKYFRTRWLEIGSGTLVGQPPYKLEYRRITETWVPARAGAAPWRGFAELGFRPAGPQDVARWRAQGSPSSWARGGGDPVMSASAGRPALYQLTADSGVGGAFPLGSNTSWTAAEINALPTDPARLRDRLAKGVRASADATEQNRYVFEMAIRLLLETPASPQLRGAALRVLAALPGIEMRQDVKDPIGRKGTEFALATMRPGQPAVVDGRRHLIIDTGTAKVLSAGFDSASKSSASVVLESGWTNQDPRPPAAAVR